MTRKKQPAITRDEVSPDKAYSVSQVAGLLNYHPGHVRRLISKRVISAVSPNGHDWCISGEELLRVLEGKDRQGGILPAKPTKVELGEYNTIVVTPEETKRMGWQPSNEEAA
jgi:excisionase family DNA binding protein